VPKENPVDLVAPYNLKRRVVEAGSAVTGRRGRVWGWTGHTLRRPDGHVAKTALKWNP